MLRALLLTVVLACPAQADCVTADDLATGISFTRQSGQKGHIVAEKGALQIEYIAGHPIIFDRRTTRLGLYETHFSQWLEIAPLVGSAPPAFDWSFKPKPPVPKPDTTWDGTIRQVKTNVGYGAEMVESVSRQGSDLKAHFSYLTQTEAKLSGCTYQILPVEATFTGKEGSFTRRWIYFPDLGFGLETKRDGVQNGLTALTPG